MSNLGKYTPRGVNRSSDQLGNMFYEAHCVYITLLFIITFVQLQCKAKMKHPFILHFGFAEHTDYPLKLALASANTTSNEGKIRLFYIFNLLKFSICYTKM